MKDQLIFDTTDANTIADSDSVGAYLRASDGTLLTHTDVSGKKALDVRIAEGINVEVDLAFGDDSVTAHQGGTWTITSITNDVNIADGGNSITVDAVQLDIDDLNATDDAVQAWCFDGAGNSIGSTAGALDVNIASGSVTVSDAALADTAILSAADTLALAGTAEKVIAANLASRKYLFVYNNDNRKMYIGHSGVDNANGFPVAPGAYLEMRAGAAVDVYYDSDKTGHAIRTLELS